MKPQKDTNKDKTPEVIYVKKKQQMGGFKIIKFKKTDRGYVKSTIRKGLSNSVAEEMLYKLNKHIKQ